MIMITIRLKQWSFSDLVSCLFCEMIEEEEEVHGVNAWNVWDNQNQNDFPRFQRAHRRGMSLAGEDLDKISPLPARKIHCQKFIFKWWVPLLVGGESSGWKVSVAGFYKQKKTMNDFVVHSVL